ncbi:MAG: sulfate transporter CysZ [Desulfuromonadaceae bacterium]|nr:sulfate transporter CysZ [Desulfuromonadaceae bacterium]
MRGFINGLLSIWQAWIFLYRNPSLFRYAAIPFFINVVVFIAIIFLGNEYFSYLVGSYISTGDNWLWQILAWGARGVAFLFMLVVVFFTFTVVGNFIAAPFNDVLSEKTEHMLMDTTCSEAFSVAALFSDVWRTVVDEVRKLSMFVIVMMLLLPVNFIPLIGPPVFGICTVLLTLYFLVVEYTGFVFSRKRLRFSHQRVFIRTHRTQALGFGLAVMLTLMLPLVQFLTIPLAVVAATLFCTRNMDENMLNRAKLK